MLLRKSSPINIITKIGAPVFFVHGMDDNFIPKEMSIELYSRKRGAKKLYLAPQAGHVEAFKKNGMEYKRLVDEFLMEAGVIINKEYACG